MIVHLTTQYVTIGLAIWTALMVPTLALVVKLVTKATRLEERLTAVIADLKELHEASDRRIRWLEETAWKGLQSAVRNQSQRR